MYKRVKFKKFPQINEWMFPKTTVILISGRAGVGKTTVAEAMKTYLSNEVTKYVHTAHFAIGVKMIAYLIGWDGNKDAEGRKLLQDIGNFGREYDKDAWVNFMIKHLNETVPEELLDVVIVDDWRFPNEADYFLERHEKYRVFTINIKSTPEREVLRGTREWKDVSETSLDNWKYFKYILTNYGSLEDFEHEIIELLLDIILESKQGGKP